MQIFIKSETLHLLEVEESTVVGYVKTLVEAVTGLAVCDQILSFGGRPLADEATLSSYNVEELATITVTCGLRGGELHVPTALHLDDSIGVKSLDTSFARGHNMQEKSTGLRLALEK